MPRPLDQCKGCGVTVLWLRAEHGLLRAFNRPETTTASTTAPEWALVPGTNGAYGTARRLSASTVPLQNFETPAQPHSETCPARPRALRLRRRRRYTGAR